MCVTMILKNIEAVFCVQSLKHVKMMCEIAKACEDDVSNR